MPFLSPHLFSFTPLWQQEIIDSLIIQDLASNVELNEHTLTFLYLLVSDNLYLMVSFLQKYNELNKDGIRLLSVFKNSFVEYTNTKDPVASFEDGESTSLATAGFPNVITALVPGRDEANKLGQELDNFLKQEWKDIALKVRNNVKKTVKDWISNDKKLNDFWSKIGSEFKSETYQPELLKWRTGTCWTWNKLWDAQIDNTWETYWTAVPLGDPDKDSITFDLGDKFGEWEQSQNQLSNARNTLEGIRIATAAEKQLYDSFNVGTWWGSFQARLGQLIQSVKNTRSWQIPTAPGERSSLSGQHTALHPQHLYRDSFREGGGLPAGSMRLFWRVMAEAYPGLFNGSEMLNAIELTKRMAWNRGGVAESLGLESLNREEQKDSSLEFNEPIDPNDPDDTDDETPEVNYEKLIRFPNLSSIAAGRLIHELASRNNLSKLDHYWSNLYNEIVSQTVQQDESENNQLVRKLFKRRQRRKYWSKTIRKSQVPKTDRILDEKERRYNGVMFSSKWLADDMSLEREQTNILRGLVDQAHQQSGFKNGSPADWWVIVLGDGDGMGKYVSGAKLGAYEKYIVDDKVDRTNIDEENYESLRQKTRKRMGPATHVSLNRALLDFSNRLVPYITERRFCGKVVYSGGDDVMAVLPLADLPEYLLSLRAAWSGKLDPPREFDINQTGDEDPELSSGYWHPKNELRKEGKLQGIPQRPLFTMGKDATMSLGIVVAHKSVPLPTVLETLWTAEKERAKKMPGAGKQGEDNAIPVKDGLCFRVIYGSSNILEALMKGHLLEAWWGFIREARPTTEEKIELSPLMYQLAEDLPKHTAITENDGLIAKAAQVIIKRRDREFSLKLQEKLIEWLNLWETWAYRANPNDEKDVLGTQIEDLSKLLRFTAFWLDKMSQFDEWVTGGDE